MSRKHIHSFSYFILLFEIKQIVVLLVFVQLQSALIGLIGLIGLLGITVNFPPCAQLPISERLRQQRTHGEKVTYLLS